jgi:hypothetical protein
MGQELVGGYETMPFLKLTCCVIALLGYWKSCAHFSAYQPYEMKQEASKFKRIRTYYGKVPLSRNTCDDFY